MSNLQLTFVLGFVMGFAMRRFIDSFRRGYAWRLKHHREHPDCEKTEIHFHDCADHEKFGAP